MTEQIGTPVMSDQPKPLEIKKPVVRSRDAAAAPTPTPNQESNPATVDPAASAALALAVTSAERKVVTAEPKPEAKPAPAPTVAANPAPATRPGPRDPAPAQKGAPRRILGRLAVLAAATILALGAGFAGGHILLDTAEQSRMLARAAEALRAEQDDVVRLTGDVRALKVAVEALKESVDRPARPDAAPAPQLLERIERAERAPEAALTQIARHSEQLDRIEAALQEAAREARDPAQRLAALGERLDRMERQIAAIAGKPAPAQVAAVQTTALPAGPMPPEPPAQTGSVPKDTPAKDAAVDGWILREVYDGIALIESKNRRLIEVTPGEAVPGIGRVESIERRGKRWVVVTARGVIEMAR